MASNISDDTITALEALTLGGLPQKAVVARLAAKFRTTYISSALKKKLKRAITLVVKRGNRQEVMAQVIDQMQQQQEVLDRRRERRSSLEDDGLRLETLHDAIVAARGAGNEDALRLVAHRLLLTLLYRWGFRSSVRLCKLLAAKIPQWNDIAGTGETTVRGWCLSEGRAVIILSARIWLKGGKHIRRSAAVTNKDGSLYGCALPTELPESSFWDIPAPAVRQYYYSIVAESTTEWYLLKASRKEADYPEEIASQVRSVMARLQKFEPRKVSDVLGHLASGSTDLATEMDGLCRGSLLAKDVLEILQCGQHEELKQRLVAEKDAAIVRTRVVQWLNAEAL